MERQFSGNSNKLKSASVGGLKAAADILNAMETAREAELMASIRGIDTGLGERIEELMFVFDDVGKLDDRSLQRLLREIDARTLSLALKTAKEEMRERIMAGMSARAVTALKEEISMLGAVRVRDVEAAQAQIVAQVRALEAAGEITIGAGASEDAFIE